jgi:saccharopine dehydrogenase (NAD+, L-lysine-forming)
MSHKLLVLGGYGNAGRLIARLLLQETDVQLILAGRSVEKAQKTARELNAHCGEHRVTGIRADASNPADLNNVFRGIDMVVVASSTAAFSHQVAAAALEAGIDYLDIQYATTKTAALQALSQKIEDAGRCFITDGGFHPGLPAALVRFAAMHFDRLEKANVGSVIQVDWKRLELGQSTIEEFVREFEDFQALYFKDGSWRRVGVLASMIPRYMDFGREFGRRYTVPMFLEEMRSLPKMFPSLKETGFFVGGFNWFVDWILTPIILLVLRLFPEKGIQPMAKLLIWGLETFTRPPYGTLVKLEARGIKEGLSQAMDVTVYHQDGYMATAVPAVACLLQYLDGSIRKPGLWLQALVVEPTRFMQDMERMGLRVQVS